MQRRMVNAWQVSPAGCGDPLTCIADPLVRRLALEPRCMVSGARSGRRRPTDARGHLGAAPPGPRRADTRSPCGARRLRFAGIDISHSREKGVFSGRKQAGSVHAYCLFVNNNIDLLPTTKKAKAPPSPLGVGAAMHHIENTNTSLETVERGILNLVNTI